MKAVSSDEPSSPSSHNQKSRVLDDLPTSSSSVMHLPPQTDNPLRKIPTSTSGSVSSTPLLKASLNSPPIAHTLNKKTTGMDLSMQGCKRHHSEENRSETQYTNLLLQLRQSSSTSLETIATNCPAKKPKSGSSGSPCFQCPVCQKNFKRHIALNTHFQNEHIGQGEKDEEQNKKTCKLCSHKAEGMMAIRQHLWEKHQIDLESPTTCLIPSGDTKTTRKVRPSPEPPEPNNNTIKVVEGEQATDLSLKPKSDHHSESVSSSEVADQWKCYFCNIVFPNQTLYFLHRGFHSDNSPWRCNGCGKACQDMYDFNTHLLSESHN